MATPVDRLWRVGLRAVYVVGTTVLWLLRIRLRGVFVLVRHGDALLVVKNSYKATYSLPGGLLKRGESLIDGAVRETWEEVGIRLDPARVRFCRAVSDDHGGTANFVEALLAERPPVRIDQREIVWAEFVPLAEVRALPVARAIARYLDDPVPPEETPCPSTASK